MDGLKLILQELGGMLHDFSVGSILVKTLPVMDQGECTVLTGQALGKQWTESRLAPAANVPGILMASSLGSVRLKYQCVYCRTAHKRSTIT